MAEFMINRDNIARQRLWNAEKVGVFTPGEPADFLEDAFNSYRPGTHTAEDIVYAAFLKAGHLPPYPIALVRDLETVAQDLIDNSPRLALEGEA